MAKTSSERGKAYRARQKAEALPSAAQLKSALLMGFKRLSRLTDTSPSVIDNPDLTPLTEAQIHYAFGEAVGILCDEEQAGFSRKIAKTHLMKALRVERHARLSYLFGVVSPKMQAYEDDVVDALLALYEEQGDPPANSRALAVACVKNNRDFLYRKRGDEFDGSPEAAAQELFDYQLSDPDALDVVLGTTFGGRLS